MSLKPVDVHLYHVFLASPGDVNAEREYVRRFFDDYNRHTAHLWNAEFRVIDWENYATIGVGRPQELITQQTLEKFKTVQKRFDKLNFEMLDSTGAYYSGVQLWSVFVPQSARKCW